MGKSGIRNLTLSTTEDLFSATTPFTPQQEGERIVRMPLSHMHYYKGYPALRDKVPFAGQPYRMRDDDPQILEMLESVKLRGVRVAGLVRPDPDGGYEIIAGHRRHRVSELAGLTDMPVVIREMTDEEAAIEMVDTNIQREDILPSERAWAYRIKLEAMKRQGARTDLTSPQVAAKSTGDTSPQVAAKSFRTDDQIAAKNKISGDTVRRYIRLTYLITPLLDLVDTEKLKFGPAVELSFLSIKDQGLVFDVMQRDKMAPTLDQAKRLREVSEKGELNQSVLTLVFMDDKPIKGNISLKADSVRKFYPGSTPKEIAASLIDLAGTYTRLKEYFPPNTPQDEITDSIIKLVVERYGK